MQPDLQRLASTATCRRSRTPPRNAARFAPPPMHGARRRSRLAPPSALTGQTIATSSTIESPRLQSA
eukprot:14267708-Alexandrium_andersonii.AAC.1